MVVGELLETVGVPGSIALLATGAVVVWHLRSGMQFLGQVRTWVMATAIFALILLAGEAGLVPGLDPQLGKFLGWAVDVLEELVQAALDMVP